MQMKKFFENKRNRIIVAIAAVVILLTVVIATVVVTRKKKAYEPNTTAPSVEVLTEEPTVTEAESESQASTEPVPTENTDTQSESKTDKNEKTQNSKSDNASKDKSENNGSNDKKPVINLGSIQLEGRWGMTEYISPSELLDADFIAETGFNKKLSVSTRYQFNSDKTFVITYTVNDENDYVAALREAFIIYYKDEHPEWTPETLENRMDQTAWQTFWEICDAVIGVSYDAAQVSGTYTNDATTIYYRCDGASFSETYVIKDKTLTLTGSSEGNEGYPITLTRW